MEPLKNRLRYHNEALDSTEYDDPDETHWPLPLVDAAKANLVSSLCTDGLHRPAIDIDVRVELLPSSTEGHGHLYFPETALTWEQYEKLLTVLVEVGIVEDRYLQHSRVRQQTLLRPPGVKKVARETAPAVQESDERF